MALAPPSTQAVSLVAALSSAENHDVHVAAIRARDEAFAASPQSYSHLCYELLKILIHADQLGSQIPPDNPVHGVIASSSNTSSMGGDVSSRWLHLGQIAGLLLKNALVRPPVDPNSRQPFIILQEAAGPMQQGMLHAVVQCLHAPLRNVASTILATAAVSRYQPFFYIGAGGWPELMDQLFHALQNQQQQPLGPIMALQKILQDQPGIIADHHLDAFVPVWIQQLAQTAPATASNTAYAKALMDCLTRVIPRMPSALVAHWTDYLQALSHSSRFYATPVCRSLTTILLYRPDGLSPTNNNNAAITAWILPFICASTGQSEDDDLALEACDFWLTFATMETATNDSKMSPELYETIEGLLAELIPVLLNKMVYTEEQRLEMATDQENEQNEDAKPVFHKKRGGDAEDDDDDDDGGDEDDTEWNVRKCAAASIDALAHTYGGQNILPLLLPHIEQGLTKSTDPWIHEACLLALGAIAGGCKDEMEPHLGNILPNCVQLLQQQQQPGQTVIPQLQSIAAWTISQYADWIASREDALQKSLEALLSRIRSPNTSTNVQVTCLAAIGVLVHAAGEAVNRAVQNQVHPILMETLEAYSHRKRVLLNVLDVLNSLAECCPNEGDPSAYVPKLIQLWDHLASMDPSDTTLLPLMECLATLAPALGEKYQPFALETLDNAMCMIETVGMFLMGQTDLTEEDVDPIVCATDVVDGLVLCCREQFPQLLKSSERYEPTFGNAILQLLDHEVPAAQAPAFALAGDLCRYAPTIIDPVTILKLAVENMDPTEVTLATNAVWAIGEICILSRSNPAIIEPFVPTIVQNLMCLLMGNGPEQRGIPGLSENAAVCMGRLALIKPAYCAADAPRCLLGWCDAMGKVVDPDERRDAFAGFVQTIYANPRAIPQASSNITETVVSIIFAILTWHLHPDDVEAAGPAIWSRTDITFQPFPSNQGELFAAISGLVGDLKVFAGEQSWHLVQKNLPVKVRQLFREVYKA